MIELDAWQSVLNYLNHFSTFYPLIGSWCSKIREGLPSKKRSIFAFIAMDGSIDGIAITKNSINSKLCHISINKNVRTTGLGFSLMRAAVGEMLDSGAHRVHVTTSEEVYEQYGKFFARCGFNQFRFQKDRYRRGADELEWVTSSDVLATRLLLSERYKNSAHIKSPILLQTTLMQLQWVPKNKKFVWERAPQRFPLYSTPVEQNKQYWFSKNHLEPQYKHAFDSIIL